VDTLTSDWLPPGGAHIGVTAGASTPDSVVGEVIERILSLRGLTSEDLTQPAQIAEGSPAFVKATTGKQSYA
jgi:4-hydroxy-3-methylbut-2-enyl diphosphate reductase IspH